MLGNIDVATWLDAKEDVWADPVVYTYVQIDDREFAEQIMESRLTDFVDRHFTKDIGEGAYLQVMPVRDVHLHSKVYFEFGNNSSTQYLYIVASIGIFILLLAAINFINLSTARAVNRAREVGVRKVLGAHKGGLVGQFLTESLMVTLMAVLLAVVLVETFLPAINDLLATHVVTTYFQDPKYIIMLAGIWLGVGTLAGLYPAFVLSAFRPVFVLKGKMDNNRGKFPLRKLLITAQLSMVIVLILAIINIDGQLNYMLEKDHGFDKENMVYLRMPDSLTTNLSKQQALKNDLLANPNIRSVSNSWGMPGGDNVGFAYANYKYEGMPDGDRQGGGIMQADYDYVKTMGLELLAGRELSRDFVTDTVKCLINETAVKDFGWTVETALGREVEVVGWNKFEVVGVLRDFNFENLHKKIHPMVLVVDPANRYFNIGIKVAGNLQETIPYIQKTWDKYSDGWPVQLDFMTESIERQYIIESKMSQVVRILTVLALIIAIMGILGLSSYSVSRRVKEVGIRKVLGASVMRIVMLFTKDYMLLGTIAALIGMPVAYLVVNQWLNDFAYKISFNVFMAVFSVLLVMALTIVTVGIYTIRSARANPVDSLRTE